MIERSAAGIVALFGASQVDTTTGYPLSGDVQPRGGLEVACASDTSVEWEATYLDESGEGSVYVVGLVEPDGDPSTHDAVQVRSACTSESVSPASSSAAAGSARRRRSG